MRHSTLLRVFPALVVLALASADAATVIGYTDGAVAVASRADFTGTIGTQFTVNTSGLSITHLGVQDVVNSTRNAGVGISDGLFLNGIQVGLWEVGNATPIAIVTVTNSDAVQSGGYRYVQLGTTIALTAGQSYLMGAQVGGGIEFFLDHQPGSIFSDPAGDGITIVSSNFVGGAALSAPTTASGTVGRWGAANAIVVPELSVALLGSLGLLGLLRRRRA
jgi:hypothetical protein